MAEVFPLAKNIASIRGNLFTGLIQRAQLQVQLALGERLDKDLAALNDKFDGRAASEIETQILTLSDDKSVIADKVQNLNNALDKFNDVRAIIYSIFSSAESGLGVTFDTFIDPVNSSLGSAVINKDNLIGNPGAGAAGLPEVIVIGTQTVTIKPQFLGSDYSVTLGDGTVMRPDFENKTFAGINFSDLTLDSLVGDTIQFTDTNTVTVYNGTLTRTGTGILSAWLYNDFAAQADIDQALLDVQAANTLIDQTEDDYRRSIALLTAGVSRLDSQLQSLSDQFDAQTTADLTDKQAERKALTVRFDLTLNNLALTANINNSFIQGLFLAPDLNKKESVFSIIQGQTESAFASTTFTPPDTDN